VNPRVAHSCGCSRPLAASPDFRRSPSEPLALARQAHRATRLDAPERLSQHYLELVRPEDAKSWFSITPGQDGKIVYFEVPKDGEQGATGAEKIEAAEAPANAVARWG
jgi:hypothetical protein